MLYKLRIKNYSIKIYKKMRCLKNYVSVNIVFLKSNNMPSKPVPILLYTETPQRIGGIRSPDHRKRTNT
jgi:hypothetical protein